MTTVAGPLVRRGTRRHSNAERAARVSAVDRPEPWNRLALLVAGVLMGLGLFGLFLGWYGISGSADIEEQARWLGLGVGALIVAGFGMVAWLLFGLISVGALRREVVRDLAAHRAAHAVAPEPTTSEQAPPGTFGIATGMRRYHRAECDVLAGKAVRWLDFEALRFADAIACGMCKPDEDRA